MNFSKITNSGVLNFSQMANPKTSLIFTGKFSLIPKVESVSTHKTKNGIDEIENKQYSPKKIFHFFKKKFRSGREMGDFITNILPKLKPEERFIGCLPKKWIESFPKNKIKEKTQELNNIISTFAETTSLQTKTPNENLLPLTQKLSQQIEKFLGQKCDISYIGSGGFGRVFRIKCADEDLALKIFHDNPRINTTLKEIANAASLNHLLKPNQRATFYCGRIPAENTTNGSYMLMQYIQPNPAAKINKHRFFDLDPLIYRKFDFSDDHGENFVNNKLVDFGLINLMYSNRAMQNFAKKLLPLIKNGNVEAINQMKKTYQDNIDFKETLSRIYQLLKIPTNYQYNQDQIKAINTLTEKAYAN